MNATNYSTLSFDHIPGFEVLWAGSNPYAAGFCFGSSDGRLLLTEESVGREEIRRGCPEEEPINGVANVGPHVAVSTPANWALWGNPTNENPYNYKCIDGGTHGIIATASGYFVGPMGNEGLRVLHAATGEVKTLGLSGASRGSLYFYKTAALQDESGTEILVGAARALGIAALPFPDIHDKEVQTIGFNNWDVVDVCPLDERSFAVAALGKDGMIRLFRNILTDKKPAELHFSDIEGKAYRILSCRGNLVVLTSKMICILYHFASSFLSGKVVELEPVTAIRIPIDAVDIAICQNRYLLVVAVDNTVVQIDLTSKQVLRNENINWTTPKNLPSPITVTMPLIVHPSAA